MPVVSSQLYVPTLPPTFSLSPSPLAEREWRIRKGHDFIDREGQYILQVDNKFLPTLHKKEEKRGNIPSPSYPSPTSGRGTNYLFDSLYKISHRKLGDPAGEVEYPVFSEEDGIEGGGDIAAQRKSESVIGVNQCGDA